MKVKICGITNIEDALMAENLGADALGFIFFKASKRYISPESAGEIIKSLKPFTSKVGVFVNEEHAIVNEIASSIGLSVVQLHGDETYDYIKKINHNLVKAIRVKDLSDIDSISNYPGCIFLLDTFSNNLYGGTGTTFNWKLVPELLRKDIILAGGVSINNIDEIMKNIKPYAVDVSSSIEVSPGIKDHEKMKELFYKIKSYRG